MQARFHSAWLLALFSVYVYASCFPWGGHSPWLLGIWMFSVYAATAPHFAEQSILLGRKYPARNPYSILANMTAAWLLCPILLPPLMLYVLLMGVPKTDTEVA